MAEQLIGQLQDCGCRRRPAVDAETLSDNSCWSRGIAVAGCERRPAPPELCSCEQPSFDRGCVSHCPGVNRTVGLRRCASRRNEWGSDSVDLRQQCSLSATEWEHWKADAGCDWQCRWSGRTDTSECRELGRILGEQRAADQHGHHRGKEPDPVWKRARAQQSRIGRAEGRGHSR